MPCSPTCDPRPSRPWTIYRLAWWSMAPTLSLPVHTCLISYPTRPRLRSTQPRLRTSASSNKPPPGSCSSGHNINLPRVPPLSLSLSLCSFTYFLPRVSLARLTFPPYLCPSLPRLWLFWVGLRVQNSTLTPDLGIPLDPKSSPPSSLAPQAPLGVEMVDLVKGRVSPDPYNLLAPRRQLAVSRNCGAKRSNCWVAAR